MKAFIFLTFFINSLFAFGESIHSFEADFKQTITDDTGKVLSYEGKMYTKRPNFVLWNYTKPERVAKMLYINKTRAVLVQPMLEQATITQISNEMNFFDILSSAKPVDQTHYKAKYKEMDFILEEDNGVIISLSYKDELENDILIIFSDQRQNRPLEDDIFIPKVPKEYDIIRNQ